MSLGFLLLGHDIGGGVSLQSTVSYVWECFSGSTLLPNTLTDMAPREMHSLSAVELRSLYSEMQSALVDSGDLALEDISVWTILMSLCADWPLLSSEPVAQLTTWTVALIEAQLGLPLQRATRLVLEVLYSSQVPFCFRRALEIAAEAGSDASTERQDFYMTHVAVPLVHLAWGALGSVRAHGMTIELDGSRILVTVKQASMLCVEVRSSADELDPAWGEVVQSNTPLLAPETCFSSVVMAVAGQRVRIGILTLLGQPRPEAVTGLPTLSETLPSDVLEGLAAAQVQCPAVGAANLSVRFIIEFSTDVVHPLHFDRALSQFFEHLLGPARVGVTRDA